MSKVTFDYSKACGFVQDHEMQYMSELAEQAKEKLLARTTAYIVRHNECLVTFFCGKIFQRYFIKSISITR